ncbi:alpha/beta hydrolase [Neobacillus drentensis]|uniref:RBBP9/YdeN family alpha/beta hydrolase n=1 Tax=Neobacillus drentensis TaxID=220684 RepID=UPI002FFFE3E6
MNQQSFLIIHGLGGSGPDHWQTWLAHELTERNYHVCYPTFSQFESPIRKVWLEELHSAVKTIPTDHRLTVITHSLGCILWLHYAEIQTKRLAQQIILVTPPSPTIVLSEAKSFYPVPLKGQHLSRTAEDTLFVHSSNDPYCSMEDAKNYLNLAFPSIVLPNAGHINTNSGHGKWPWMLDLCLSKGKIEQNT